jgi:hypothetical protein
LVDLLVLLSRSIEIGPFGIVQYRCKVQDQSWLLLRNQTSLGYQCDPTHWLPKVRWIAWISS